MTLAILIVIAAVVSLVFILRIAVSRSLQISKGASLPTQLRPLDLAAFRNLSSPDEEEFLRRNLEPRQFRIVRREQLRAMAAYVQQAGRNAAVLVAMGQAAMKAADAQTVEAAQRLVNDALTLRRNVMMALLRIYVAMAWPNSGMAAAHIADRYERLNSSAMLLGRLQNPRVPVRLSATLR